MLREAVAGVDIGGSRLKLALAETDGRLFARQVRPLPVPATPTLVVNEIVSALRELILAHRRRLCGLGVGVPGRIDAASGVTEFLPNLSAEWSGFALGDRLREDLGCSTRLLNDARLATLGELEAGHGRRFAKPTFALLTLGTGVGGGFVVAGELALGRHGAAGEVGHLVVDPGGAVCACGGRGCLEIYGGAAALIALANRELPRRVLARCEAGEESDSPRVDPLLLGRLAAAGEAAAIQVIREWADWIGLGVANLITLIDPDFVVLSGGLSLLGEPLFSTVRRVVAERAKMSCGERVPILASELADQAGLVGAVVLAREGGERWTA